MQDHDERAESETIISIFDSACLAFGDLDAISFDSGSSVCYYELQEYSKDLSSQLHHRFRPSYVLVDCLGHVAAEAVSLLACMRINVEFVPVSCYDQHAGGRLNVLVQELNKSKPDGNVVAIVCCSDDEDPMLGVLAQADVHQVLYVDKVGNPRERLNVPDSIPRPLTGSDNLYVLFTSGTSGNNPKAVIGSQVSTLRRLQWFRNNFEPSPRIGRRTKLTFVDSITELFGALLYPPHSKLVAVDDPQILQSEGMRALLKLSCTQLTLLPSQLGPLLQLQTEELASLERVVVSGEPCPAALLIEFREQKPGATLINLYGQTETTGDVLCAVLSDMEHPVVNNVVAVGKPMAGNSVCSRENGELVVTGNISNGYLNDDANTGFAEFATGDTGFCKEGVWYVQGRVDEACKVNGILTYPTEVEAAFCKVYSIDSDMVAATIVDHDIYVVVEKQGAPFSRANMKEAGLPWNLIPKQVFFRNGGIPRKLTGAGKIDRIKVRQYVQDTLSTSLGGAKISEDPHSFESIIASVLKVAVNDLVSSKSFVENGGDSAAAVTFLYQLQSCGLLKSGELTAVDILHSNSVAELKGVVLGDKSYAKRQRTEEPLQAEFRPCEPIRVSDQHLSVQFAACVDARPLVHKRSIFAACQGGVVQRVNFLDGKVEACRHFLGWMIQANLLIAEEDETLIVCAYTRVNKGLVAALSLDLKDVKWKQEFDDGAIKVTPLMENGTLWICHGQRVSCISAKDGALDDTLYELPMSTSSQPFLHNQSLVFVSSEYETGIMMKKSDGSFGISLSDSLGPVYKNATELADGSVLMSDSYGSLHHCVDETTVRSVRISSKPLSSACVVGDSVIVGSYNSTVYCLDHKDWSSRWEFTADGTIYSSPLGLRNSVVICTTAGDVIRLEFKTGKELGRQRMQGEIWSDPVAVEDKNLIVFGARDSRLHIVTISD